MEKTIITNKVQDIKSTSTPEILKDTAICFFAFISGGTNVFNIFSPFGASFCTLFFGESYRFLLSVAFSVLGRFIMGNNLFNIKYCLWGILISLISLAIYKSNIKISLWQKSLSSALAMVSVGLIVSLLYGGSKYILFTSIIESVSIFVFSGVMLKGFDTAKNSFNRKLLSPEETISLLIVLGICIVSLGDIEIFSINLKTSLSVATALMCSYRLGVYGGAIAGAFIGFMLMICFQGGSDMFSVLTISSLTAGAVRKKGKVLTSLTFFSLSTIMIFYISNGLLNIGWFKSLFLGILLFLVIPDKCFEFINRYEGDYSIYDSRYYDMMKNITEKSLRECSNSFYALSNMFKKLESSRHSNSNNIKTVIDEVGGKVCKSCGLFSYCWERDFYNTYKIFYDTVGLCERRGQIFSTDFSGALRSTCAKLLTLTEELHKGSEESRSKIFWENRIKESRDLVGEQLFAVGKIFENLKGRIDVERVFREDIENDLKAYFDNQDVELLKVMATESGKGEIRVSFKLAESVIEKSILEGALKVINKSSGRKMRKDGYTSEEGYIYREAKRFNVLSASSVFCKKGNSVSGDNFTFLPLSDGEFVVALSDGMGSGEEANRESFFAIELLESFFRAGFDIDVSIKLINSALLLNSTKDSFATLDICRIDTYNRRADFVKTGSASSYILRNKKVFAIRQETLPIGVFSGAEIEKSSYEIFDGDIIIMVTDGIEDIVGGDRGEDELWFESIFSKFRSYNPKDIADYIMSEAVKKAGGEINDDMTVVVSRIWEGL